MIYMLIQNMNDVYKMFLAIELTALFKAKINLNHSNDISWAAGTWAFAIPSGIVTHFCNYAWGICKCNYCVKENRIYAKQNY